MNNSATLTGTFHLLNGSRYAGKWNIVSAVEVENGWIAIKDADGAMWHTRTEDMFASEAEARAEGRARRAPRKPARTQLYGDFAQMAAFNGIRTDGTGRRGDR